MAWNYAFEKDVGRFHIFLEIFSTTESTSRGGGVEGHKAMGVGDFGVRSI